MRTTTVLAGAVALAALSTPLWPTPAAEAQTSAVDLCIVPDDGAGTARVPPSGCAFLGPTGAYMISGGLPPGTTIEADPIHLAFHCRSPLDGDPCLIESGGVFGASGGQREVFDLVVVLDLRGTGALAGFHRVLAIPAAAETHSGPRTPGDPVQSFPTDLFQLQGSIFGDPDFAELTLIAGTANGLPSPGQTTLTDLGDGRFLVESFFTIAYVIGFEGAPGSALEGLFGTTPGTLPVKAYGQRHRCVVVDDGTGTVELPPPGCDHLSLEHVHEIIDGLPAGTTIKLSPRLQELICGNPAPDGTCGQPGGGLSGEVEQFAGTLALQLEGTGGLDGFRRNLRMPVTVETHSGPRTPGDPVQEFPTDLFSLQGSIFGDPDFAELTLTAGSNHGLPSPGRTILSDNGDGTFNVDSFFDVEYQLTFQGAPGGAVEGLAGTTQGSLRMQPLDSQPQSIEPALNGTVELPPPGAAYTNRHQALLMLDGLPTGSTIEIEPSHMSFLCTQPGGICGVPDGSLGGEKEEFDSVMRLEMFGTGQLAGFNRTLHLPLTVETHSGPRGGGAPLGEPATDPLEPRGVVPPATQSFPTDLFSLQGSIFGDPDFAELTLTAGTDNALPSPGHTMLTDRGDGTFLVDGFYDICYTLDFIGAPGGALDGLFGSDTGSLRFTAVDDPSCPSDVTVGDRTISVPEAIRSRGLLTATGALTVDAQTDLVARYRIVLENGFQAQVATGQRLSLGVDPLIRCPFTP